MDIKPNSDIVRAIEIIDQRIESLREIRGRLAEEFGVSKNGNVRSPAETEQKFLFSNPAKTRKDMLAEFLKTQGPRTRKEMIERAGIPAGTIAYCLNDDTRFRRLADGRWDVTQR